jgi:NTE family protein
MRVHAVFEGGGVRGIGFVGALHAAEQAGVQFGRVAGTSAGAIVAALIACGYKAEHIGRCLKDIPWKLWARGDAWHRFAYVGPTLRLLTKKGLHSADMLEQTIDKWLARHGVRTFADIRAQSLTVVASDISRGKLLLLPEDIAAYGIDPATLSVARAVRMSASIPYFFEPVTILKERVRCTIVDGGVLSNFPLWIFDELMHENVPLTPVIGFRLIGSRHVHPRRIRGPLSMLDALLHTMLDAQDERYIEKHQRFRTVKIPTGLIAATQFHLTDAEIKQLIDSGYAAGTSFFDQWSYARYDAILQRTSAHRAYSGRR